MRIILVAVILSSVIHLHGQSAKDGTGLLRNVSRTLNSLTNVEYNYLREMRYFSENYRSQDSASVYMEFRKQLPLGFRFQAGRSLSSYIYDGFMSLNLDEKSMTIDSATSSPRRMESVGYVYNSMATLRNILPLVLASDSFAIVQTDTTVNGKNLLSIRMDRPRVWLGSLNGINTLDDSSLRRSYLLLVDKATLLPYQFVTKLIHGVDARDYVSVTFINVTEDIDFFYKKFPPTYKMLYNGRELFDRLGFDGCPSSVLVNRDGVVANVFYGYNEKAINENIDVLLK